MKVEGSWFTVPKKMNEYWPVPEDPMASGNNTPGVQSLGFKVGIYHRSRFRLWGLRLGFTVVESLEFRV